MKNQATFHLTETEYHIGQQDSACAKWKRNMQSGSYLGMEKLIQYCGYVEKPEDVKRLESITENMPEDAKRLGLIPENMPEFPGGLNAMIQFIADHIHYPEKAMKDKVQGLVVVTFIVERDGKLTNFEVLKDIGAGCGAEGIKALEKMPRWTPGTINGEPVRVQFNLPIRFRL